MSSSIDEAKQRATMKIKTGWQNIAADYTFAWMGPIEAVPVMFPDFAKAVAEIKSRVTPQLPVVVYQSRQSPPERMCLVVPYVAGGNPYNSRVLGSHPLSPEQQHVLGDFAQAFWFLIGNGVLPHPAKGKALEKKLIEWTDAKLLRL